ncbi:GAP family protein [Microbacterium sediminicola]|uniref:GAP family protein n=1 Tax=Microbacterium sediminicola TaxID=415210 RepID=A0ABN2IBS6_9MICO
MEAALGHVLPLALGIALSPLPIIAAILLLLAPKARSASVGFLIGWIIGILTAVIVFMIIATVLPTPSVGGTRPVQAIIHLALGALLVLLAVRQFRAHARAGGPPTLPTWMQALDRLGFWDALGLGVLLAAVNPKNLILGAESGIQFGLGSMSVAGGIWAILLYTLVAASTILVPVVAFLVAEKPLRHPLDALRGWLERENAVIMGVVLLVLGVVVIGKGIAAL